MVKRGGCRSSPRENNYKFGQNEQKQPFYHWQSIKGTQQLEKHYFWKTAELRVGTVGVCCTLAWGCSHLLTTPSSEGAEVWSQQRRLSQPAPLRLRSKGLTPFAVVGEAWPLGVVIQILSPLFRFTLNLLKNKKIYSFIINIYIYYRKRGKQT